jgi:hypothetical protein
MGGPAGSRPAFWTVSRERGMGGLDPAGNGKAWATSEHNSSVCLHLGMAFACWEGYNSLVPPVQAIAGFSRMAAPARGRPSPFQAEAQTLRQASGARQYL